MGFEEFQDERCGGHLESWNRTNLAILNPFVTLMPPTKFRLIGIDNIRFGRYHLQKINMATVAAILDLGTRLF